MSASHVKGNDVAAADVDVIVELDRHRLRCGRLLDVPITQPQSGHARPPPRGQHLHLVPAPQDARVEPAGIPPEIGIGTGAHRALGADDELDREPGLTIGDLTDGQGLEHLEQAGAGVPTRRRGPVDDVVAVQRRHRNGSKIGQPEAEGHLGGASGHLEEACLGVIDEVDLVDGEDHVRHAQQGGDGQVAAGLLDHALAGIDEEDDDIGGARPGDGVARVLDMAGAVGQDEGPLLGREVAVGDIDRDALLALRPQAVGEQGEVGAGESAVTADSLDGVPLVGEDRLGVVEQPAHEGGLAVVDGAGRGQAQHG